MSVRLTVAPGGGQIHAHVLHSVHHSERLGHVMDAGGARHPFNRYRHSFEMRSGHRGNISGSVDVLKFIPSFRRKPESIIRKVNKSKTLLTNSVIGFPPRIKYGVTFFRGNPGALESRHRSNLRVLLDSRFRENDELGLAKSPYISNVNTA